METVTDTDTDKHTNTKQHGYVSTSLRWDPIAVNAVLVIFRTTGNVKILIIITCNKDKRTVPNMYILNLGVNDIFHLTVLFSEAWVNIIFD